MAPPPSAVDREAARLERNLAASMRDARARTRAAVARTVQIAEGEERKRRARGVHVAWTRLPSVRRSGGSTTKKRLHLGHAPNRGTHTIHFALSQTHSAPDAAAHQRYIEREEAVAASFGTIADTQGGRMRFWQELERRGINRSGRLELRPGIPPLAKRRVVDALLASDDPTPGDLDRGRLERLATASAAELDRATIRIVTRTAAEHDPLAQLLRDAADDAALLDDTDEHRSRLGPAPDPAAERHPPGVQIRTARQAALIVSPRIDKDTITALAAAIETPETARSIGLDPEMFARWQRGDPPDREVQLRSDAQTIDALLVVGRQSVGLADDADVPGITEASRGIKEARLEKGVPPALKRAAIDWWARTFDDAPPFGGRTAAKRWAQLKDADHDALDDELISLPLPIALATELDGLLASETVKLKATPTLPGATSGYPQPERRGPKNALPGLKEVKPRASIVQRRIVMELAHEISQAEREKSVRAWCAKNLKGLGWHAVIHAPEDKNDSRNWHAHIVYSNVAVERRPSGVGWTFEDQKTAPKPNETIRTLNADGPLRGRGRNQLIQRWRKEICDHQNVYLNARNIDKIYDHRSYRTMGVERVPGEHLGPGRFRRELDGTTTARGMPASAWTDAEEALRARLRTDGAPAPARERAGEVLELARLCHALPEEADGARDALEAERERAKRDLAELLTREQLASASRTIAQILGDMEVLPRKRARPWWEEALETIEAIRDPWLAGARAEDVYRQRAGAPDFANAIAEEAPAALALETTVKLYRDATEPFRQTARNALGAATTERQRDATALAFRTSLSETAFDRAEQVCGPVLGAEIDERADRAGRARAMRSDLGHWAHACRGADAPGEVREATRLFTTTHARALKEDPKLAARFRRISERSARAAYARATWATATSREDVRATARANRGAFRALSNRERRAVRRGLSPAETPDALMTATREWLADPTPAASKRLRALNPRTRRMLRVLMPKHAHRIDERLRAEDRADATVAKALARPDATDWLALERDHRDAVHRRPETRAALDGETAATTLKLHDARARSDTAFALEAAAVKRQAHPARFAALAAAHPELAEAATRGETTRARLAEQARQAVREAALGASPPPADHAPESTRRVAQGGMTR